MSNPIIIRPRVRPQIYPDTPKSPVEIHHETQGVKIENNPEIHVEDHSEIQSESHPARVPRRNSPQVRVEVVDNVENTGHANQESRNNPTYGDINSHPDFGGEKSEAPGQKGTSRIRRALWNPTIQAEENERREAEYYQGLSTWDKGLYNFKYYGEALLLTLAAGPGVEIAEGPGAVGAVGAVGAPDPLAPNVYTFGSVESNSLLGSEESIGLDGPSSPINNPSQSSRRNNFRGNSNSRPDETGEIREPGNQGSGHASKDTGKSAFESKLDSQVKEEANARLSKDQKAYSKGARNRESAYARAGSYTTGAHPAEVISDSFVNLSAKFKNFPGTKPTETPPGGQSNVTYYKVHDPDAFLKAVDMAYGGSLNSLTRAQIRDYVTSNQAIGEVYGVPGLHAEVRAANDLYNKLDASYGEGAARQRLEAGDISVSTYKLGAKSMSGETGGPFLACQNCSGILPSSINATTGRTTP